MYFPRRWWDHSPWRCLKPALRAVLWLSGGAGSQADSHSRLLQSDAVMP